MWTWLQKFPGVYQEANHDHYNIIVMERYEYYCLSD